MIKNVLAGAAAIGLAVSPAAASAGTRAASALPTIESGSVTMGARTATTVKKEEQLAGASLIIAILAITAVVIGVIAAADDNDRTDG